MRPVLRLLPPAGPAAAASDGPLDDLDQAHLDADLDGALEDDLPLTVPVAQAGRTPWHSTGGTTWVPAALLLAAAGQCSCDTCCADLARRKARRQLTAV